MHLFVFIIHRFEVFAAVNIYIFALLFGRWVRTIWRNVLFPSYLSLAEKVAGYTEYRGERAVEDRTDGTELTGQDWTDGTDRTGLTGLTGLTTGQD
jgi:hypothetical protein